VLSLPAVQSKQKRLGSFWRSAFWLCRRALHTFYQSVKNVWRAQTNKNNSTKAKTLTLEKQNSVLVSQTHTQSVIIKIKRGMKTIKVYRKNWKIS